MEITIEKKECLICEQCFAAANCPQVVALGKDGYPYLRAPVPDDDQVFVRLLKAMTACPGGCIKMS